ncbi:CLUMA_CG009549, isoform A [Clunio marinus]|uniref:CLUMA_CG009549, isoform A n=1 Tax=Clunio marinus TaxID=568069 RepID=A0A1J1I734_9DIPT|nr:CLUMA_CG009549, isoform A [Clunio marinus]
MDNPEEVMQILERFNVSRNKEISAQLEEYLSFVARTGDSVYAWSLVKNLYREKLVNVITDFYNETPTKELPQYPNVDPFNYETMKKMLIEKLDSFASAPFTIQRISELLSDPKKQYNRIDKFMRAVEKTILVVSTVPPGRHRSESENGDSLDSALNGDFSSEVNVDIEMENDRSYEEPKEPTIISQMKDSSVEKTAPNGEPDEKKYEVETTSKVTQDEGEKSSKEEKKVSPSLVPAVVLESEEKSKADDDTKEISPLNESSVKTTEKVKETEVETLVQKSSEITNEPATTATVAESKPDENVLLNKSLRSADDEILVDTSAVISQTTPLEALENIVAIRTDPSLDTSDRQSTEVALTSESETNASSEVVNVTVTVSEDATEMEAKRLKLSSTEITEALLEQSTEVAAENVKTSAEVETPVIEAVDEPTIESSEITSTQPEPVIELNVSALLEKTEPIAEPTETITEKIGEPLIEISEIPIEIVPSTDAEISATEMETIPTPTVITENTMSLDEDEPPAIELEMTPIANKMDTDETIEGAPMDFEDDAEPMDQ